MRRARHMIGQLPVLYHDAFVAAMDEQCGWPCECLALLNEWGVSPWEEAESKQDFISYRKYVYSFLDAKSEAQWLAQAATHASDVPYLV